MTNNPYSITLEDFVFYVIYTHDRGYGSNTSEAAMRKIAKSDLNVETVPGHRFRLTEWHSVSDTWQDGTAQVKFCGICTFDGVKELIDRAYLNQTCDTMGMLTIEYGFIPAVSFSTGCVEYHNFKETESELKARFGHRYNDYIYMRQNTMSTDCYIGCMILPERLDEIRENVYGSYDDCDENRQYQYDETMRYVYGTLADTLMAYLEAYANEEDPEDINPLDFVVDFRQGVLPLFKNEAV
jgi:hypothetical protein